MDDREAYVKACEKIAEEVASAIGSDNYSWGTSINDPSVVMFTARAAMGGSAVFSCRKDSAFIKNTMRKVKKIAADASAPAENRR